MTSQQDIINELIEKTRRELAQPQNPQSRSRVWKDPEGYKYLVQWSNLVLLRFLIRLFTDSLPKAEYRRKAQLDDAGRSCVRNLEEGYKRSTTSEYVQFLGYTQGSLEEVKGDSRELTEDGFLPSRPGSSLARIGIDLGDFHQALFSYNHPLSSSKTPDFTFRPLTVLYPPLSKVRAEDLTYEIFIELISKTDWLLRKLVESLERKLASEQKFYQVERARIRGRIRGG